MNDTETHFCSGLQESKAMPEKTVSNYVRTRTKIGSFLWRKFFLFDFMGASTVNLMLNINLTILTCFRLIFGLEYTHDALNRMSYFYMYVGLPRITLFKCLFAEFYMNPGPSSVSSSESVAHVCNSCANFSKPALAFLEILSLFN